MGLFAMGIIPFVMLLVRGRILSPSPAVNITAFKRSPSNEMRDVKCEYFGIVRECNKLLGIY